MEPSPVLPSADWLDPPAGPVPTPPPHDDLPPFAAVRKLVHLAAAFISLFIVVRTFALEPFGVPTGSMAVTLMGNHREEACPRCGYPVSVGQPAARGRAVRFADCVCPNCDDTVDLTDAPEVPGDRLLVDKTAYLFRRPRRWEVAVFRCPVDDSKPYVKRVVGLPGEAVRIADGDLTANGELLRKTLVQVRETRVPLFDMAFAPAGGWGSRWLVEPVADAPTRRPATPAGPDVLADGVLTLAAEAGPVGLTYRNCDPDGTGEDVIRDWLAYNGPPPEPRRTRPIDVASPAVHDFLLVCDVEVVSGSGTLAARLGDGGDHVTAELAVGPNSPGARVTAVPEAPNAGAAVSSSAAGVRLDPGATYRIEFAFVDRRASLAIDGTEAVPPLDLPVRAKRGGVRRPLQLGARGATVRVRNLRLYRDVHYRADGRNGTSAAFDLGPDEYFVLGDNAADSHDSREWAVPGVPGRDFLGKPFLIHQPMRLGRVTVNGQERTFRSVDWSRLRLLR